MKKNRVIVSLTSFPAAINLAPAAIRSILEGSYLPDKVILYLATPQFPDHRIPPEIEALKANPLFEVRFCDRDTRSYKKLVPALQDFPDDIIITIDDDIKYHPRMVERLLEIHKKYPAAIIGHSIRHIKTDPKGKLIPYFDWKRYKPRRYLWNSLKPSFRNLIIGAGGVLYPPHSLDPGMLDPDIFMDEAPTVDDVWFWAAAVAAGTKIAPVPFGYWRLDELGKPAEIALSTTNTRSGTDVNRIVVRNILEKYPSIKKRFEER